MRPVLFVPLAVFLIVAVALLVKLHHASPESASEAVSDAQAPVGKSVPDFALESLFVSQPALERKDLEGHYTLVNVFASWCVTCLQEHSYLLSLKKRGILPIYGINWRDKKQDVREWLNTLGNPYTKIGWDYTGEAAIAFGATGAPESFLVNPKGDIIYRYAGPIDEKVIEEEIVARINK